MLDSQTAKELSVFLSAGSIRMLLEKPYDKIFRTKLGMKLKQLGTFEKSTIVMALGITMFFVSRRLTTDTVLHQMLKEVTNDTWPEISKRLLNGYTDFLANIIASANNEEEKQAAAALRKLEPEVIKDFVKSQRSATLDLLINKIKQQRQYYRITG